MGAPRRAYTFQQAWRLRHSELQVLTGRADARRSTARKWLVLADTTTFAENKGPLAKAQAGEDIKRLFREFCRSRLQRTMPAQGLRVILAFLGFLSKWHPEQCTLAEFSAFVARDVIAHVDLAAEARVKKPTRPREDSDSEHHESDSDCAEERPRPSMELVDMGGGGDDIFDVHDDDVPPCEVSNFPLRDIARTLSLCLQQDDLAALPSKTRKSQSDLGLQHLDETYSSLLNQSFAVDARFAALDVRGYGRQHSDMVALQKTTIALAKRQQSGDVDEVDE